MFCFSLCKQGSESQRVTNTRPQLRTVSESLPKLLTILPRLPITTKTRKSLAQTFHSKSERDLIFR